MHEMPLHELHSQEMFILPTSENEAEDFLQTKLVNAPHHQALEALEQLRTEAPMYATTSVLKNAFFNAFNALTLKEPQKAKSLLTLGKEFGMDDETLERAGMRIDDVLAQDSLN